MTDTAAVADESQTECDLCGAFTSRPELDHDHDTDRIRGLVCRRCNFLLGVASDDPGLLQAAIEYLQHPPRDGSYQEATRKRHNAWASSPRQRSLRNERNKKWRKNHRKVKGIWVKI